MPPLRLQNDHRWCRRRGRGGGWALHKNGPITTFTCAPGDGGGAGGVGPRAYYPHIQNLGACSGRFFLGQILALNTPKRPTHEKQLAPTLMASLFCFCFSAQLSTTDSLLHCSP